ncbi:MAG: hypothetical protein DRP66_06440 [Planctomycetota bacterium]|nr:MAG: hypothetical protein DRP66_06440 [Planctomycetota bacterium]
MKKVKRVVVVGVVVLLIVAVGAALLVHLAGGRALKYGIERAGGNTLKVKVAVADVSLSILRGKLKLKGLVIANPPGYEYANLLELKSGQIDVDMKSLLGEAVAIRNLNLDGISLVIEQKDIRGNNLQDILNNLPSSKGAEADPDARKLHIDKLSITNTTVIAKLLPVPGRAASIPLKLEPIEMNNLGEDNKLTTAILTAKILKAIALGIAEQGTGLLPDEIIGPMKSVLGKSGEMIMETGKKVLETGKDVGKGLIEGGKDVQERLTEGLKGLLPGKKE